MAAPTLTLPWTTGTPHALYARVRADLGSTTTPWSAPFGFDVTPPSGSHPDAGLPGSPPLDPDPGRCGTISVNGRVELAGTGSSAPIVGGTGAFANARGTLLQGGTRSSPVDTFVVTLPSQ